MNYQNKLITEEFYQLPSPPSDSFELGFPQNTNAMNGRTFHVIPSSRGGKACGISIFCLTLIIGACMWGACDDPTISGCNLAVKNLGKALVSISIILPCCTCLYAICSSGISQLRDDT